MNLSPINIYDIPRQHKISRYNPDLLQASIYAASENYVSTLTPPYDSPQLLLLPSDDHNPTYSMNKEETYCGRVKIGYYSRKCNDKNTKERQGSIYPRALIKTRNFITVIDFTGLIQRRVLASCVTRWN